MALAAAVRLREEGPKVRLRVRPPNAPNTGGEPRPGAPYVDVIALIDTGTGRTVLQRGIAESMGLRPAGSVEIDTPSGADIASSEFDVLLEFEDGLQVESRILEAAMPVRGIRALIGREVLALGTLHYDGPAGTFTLSLTEK